MDTCSLNETVEQALARVDEQQIQWANLSWSDRKTVISELMKIETLTSRPPSIENKLIDATLVDWNKKLLELPEPNSNKERIINPLGVIGIIGSSVWPEFYLKAYPLLALLYGNGVVVKPAEIEHQQVHSTIHAWQGYLKTLPIAVTAADPETGRRVATQWGLDGLIYFGSTENGFRVQQETLSQPHKRLFLNLGARNLGTILPDAEPSAQNLQIIFESSLICNGFHCRSVNLWLVPQTKIKTWSESIHAMAKSFPIEAGSPGTVGAMVTFEQVDRYLKSIGMFEREGAEIVMRGKSLNAKFALASPTIAVYPEISTEKFSKSTALQTEILSPSLALIPYANLDQARDFYHSSHYGLLSVLIGNGFNDEFLKSLEVGRIYLNKSSLGVGFSENLISQKKSGQGSLQGLNLGEQLLRPTYF